MIKSGIENSNIYFLFLLLTMNKENKLKQLYLCAQRYGLTSKDVVDYFIEQQAKQTVSQNLPEIGMLCYADNTFSFELDNNKIVKGVVGYVENTRALVVCLQEIELPWSSSFLKKVDTQNFSDGKSATKKILQVASKSKQKAEAAQWRFDFEQNGVTKGEAFLPSLRELECLALGRKRINETFALLQVNLLSKWYWSSNTYSDDYVWIYGMTSGYKNGGYKFDSYMVRPVFWVTF